MAATEVRVGFSSLVDAQIFWASLEDPTQYHVVQIVQSNLQGEKLAYLVESNKD